MEQTTDATGIKYNRGFVKKLWIGTCFYEVKGFSPYITSLVSTIRALEVMKLPWEYKEISGDSYVDRAKNALLNAFLDDQEATHFFMIDSDESWDPESFLRVLRAAMCGAELVGGSYPCKNNWGFFGCVPKKEVGEDGLEYFIGEELGDMRLLEMYCIPGGFTCYSKAALKRAEPLLKTYHQIEVGTGKLISQIEFFRCNIEEDGGRIGEDVYFQKRFSEAGGKILLEPNCTIGHYGIQRWQGNYQELILKEKAEAESIKDLNTAFDTLNANLANLHDFEVKLENPAFVDALRCKIKEKRECGLT
jgi:hypothetical protein